MKIIFWRQKIFSKKFDLKFLLLEMDVYLVSSTF